MKKILTLLLVPLMAFMACEDEIDTPETDPRDELVGKWYVDEVTENNAHNYYEVSIAKGDPSDMLHIHNFANISENLYAEVSLNGSSLTIPNQTVDGNDIEGSGSITDNFIDFTYTLDFGAGPSIIDATLSQEPIAKSLIVQK